MLRRVVVVIAGALVVGLLGAGSAWGALSYPFTGQLTAPGGTFAGEVQGIAVDAASGNTYVAETNGVVNVFETASGTQLASLDSSLTPAGSFGGRELAVAVDDASGRVYVLDTTDGVVDVFDSAGSYVCQITGSSTPSASECNGVAGSDTPAHGFDAPRGITVDQATGEVYVIDANHGAVDVFSAGGEYLPSSSLSLEGIEGGYSTLYTRAVAVDDVNGHVYLADSLTDAVYELGASGEYLTTWHGTNTPAGSFGGAYVGVAADDAGGEVYVTDTEHQVTNVFDSSGRYLTRFGRSFQESRVTAVDQASGKVYLSSNSPNAVEIFGPALAVPDLTTGAASGVLATGAMLNGAVGPDGIQLTDCHFDYGTDASYGQSAPCVPAAGAIPADSSEHAVSATLTGLAPGTTYHYRLAGANANGANTGSDATFSTPPPPSIDSASAGNVTTTSADLSARVNPNGFDTTYRFEWGTSTAYGTSVPVPDADIGAGSSGVSVATHLSGLSTSTTYHWRVVAQNANGTTTTSDHTFVYETGGAGLPDGRAYEMVTSPHKNGALTVAAASGSSGFTDIAQDGSRVIALSFQCFADAASCNAGRQAGWLASPYAFTRTAGGWVATSLEPSAAMFTGNSPLMFGADTGSALFSLPTTSAGEDDLYVRGIDGSLGDVGPVYPHSLELPGPFSLAFAIASADFSHIIYSVSDDSIRWPFDATRGSLAGSLYEYVGTGNAQPALVGVSGGKGSTDLIGTCGIDLGGGEERSYGALSADGRTVYFTARRCGSGSGANAGTPVPANALYARIDGARTVAVSQRSSLDCTSAACLGSAPGDAAFQGASADGSKVFFTDTQQLSDDATEDSQAGDTAFIDGCARTTGATGCNLYVYDSKEPAGHNLLAASAGDTSGGGPRVRGVIAISPDGSHVYFVARGVLSGAANSQGQTARDGAENLYVFEHDQRFPTGHTAFIAALPVSEEQVLTEGVGRANVTPDGRLLVFTSSGALTADDTRSDGARQVFRYDAQTGELVRISIGERGFNDNGNAGTGDASVVYSSALDLTRSDPTMSDDGAYIFFRSPVALTPHALDDVRVGTDNRGEPTYAQNVYEYHQGHVYLISDGRDVSQTGGGSESSVVLLGSDAAGANVFFSTADQLAPQDTDTQLDYYDARVCTTSDPCIAPPAPPVEACQGEACHGTPSAAPVFGAPGSAVFSGAGNLTPAQAKPAVKVKQKVKPKKRVKKPKKKVKHRKIKHKKLGRKAARTGKHTKRGRL